jgi:hypothetical protein
MCVMLVSCKAGEVQCTLQAHTARAGSGDSNSGPPLQRWLVVDTLAA